MGFGAIIASGAKNKLMRDDLLDCIVEVRVEQSLDEPTRFGIRFQQDIIDGQPNIMPVPELQCDEMITIAVKAGDEIRCLVRGPITDAKCATILGGPGSSFEVRGEDRRVELDRKCVQRRWSGRASAIAQAILGTKFDDLRIQETTIVYGSARAQGREVLQTLNQRWTDATFIRHIARSNNLHFWIEYECRAIGESLRVREIANVKASPPRPNGSEPPEERAKPVKLVPTVPVKLRVHVEKARCQNVTSFDVSTCSERPSRFEGLAIDDVDVRRHPTSAADPQPAIRKGGLRLGGCDVQRDVCITAAGNHQELQIRAESALTESGWFVHATANTTAHMLGGVLAAHDVVDVEGMGKKHDGPYQVEAVTHVINASDHFMKINLRRNAVGGD
jgi:hypothetical protein